MPADDVGHLAQTRRGGAGEPVNAADSSANSQGLPRHPRPMTTPSHPVAAIIANASLASKMSPLPSTGTVVTASFSRAIWSQSAVPE